MAVALFIAKLMAVAYLSMGVGALFKPDYLKNVTEDFSKSPALNFLGGLIAVVMGGAIISVHNVWEANWTILVTAIGWAALIKGIMLLAFPDVMMRVMHTIYRKVNMNLYSIIVVLLGAFFAYQGFLA